MDTRYTICFAGETLDGHDDGAVRAALGRLFRADEATLDKLFSGKLQVIKRDCDRDTALKYKQAMEKAGARPVIRKHPAAARESGLTMAPPGSEVLREEERSQVVPRDIDTSAIDLDAPGTRLAEQAPPPPPPPATDHLALDEAGGNTPVLAAGEIPPAPDTSAFELTPEGTDLSDCASPSLELDLDLSALELAPPGSEVLEEQYRQGEAPPPPDVSHLSLKD